MSLVSDCWRRGNCRRGLARISTAQWPGSVRNNVRGFGWLDDGAAPGIRADEPGPNGRREKLDASAYFLGPTGPPGVLDERQRAWSPPGAARTVRRSSVS